jgi:hypothetical protein
MALSDFDSLADTEAPVGATASMGQTPYEKDFLPTQQKYFKSLSQDPKLNPLLRAQLAKSNIESAQRTYMDRANVEQAGMDIKSRQMQFETAKFTLEQAREEAARKRNMFGGLSKLQEELNPVMKDTTLDSATKKDIYGQLGVKYAGEAAVNPAVANALSAANSSLSAQPKDRITKLDYFNNGADPKYLAAYEGELGRSLEANEDVPIDIYGAGLYSGKKLKEQMEQDSRYEQNRFQQQYAGLNKVLDVAIEGKLLKNPLDPLKPSNEFEKPATKEAVTVLVNQFGTPEEQKKFQGGSAIDQLTIGQSIAIGIQSGTRLPVPAKPTRPSLRSSFTTPSK